MALENAFSLCRDFYKDKPGTKKFLPAAVLLGCLKKANKQTRQ